MRCGRWRPRRDTPLIDLTELSFQLWSSLGPEATKDYFLWRDAGASPVYPDDIADNHHERMKPLFGANLRRMQSCCQSVAT